MSEGPLRQLLTAFLLSALKKNAHVIRLVQRPSVLYFDYLDGTTHEELLPPGELGWPLLRELCAMSGATRREPAVFAVELGTPGTRRWFRATVSSGDELFRIELLPARDPYRS